MSTPYREAGEMDQTEIEIAKVREAEETKRKGIEEREKSRRENAWNGATVIAVWTIVAALLATMSMLGTCAYTTYLDDHPSLICKDVHFNFNGPHHCRSDQHLEGPNDCVCNDSASPTSMPSSSSSQ